MTKSIIFYQEWCVHLIEVMRLELRLPIRFIRLSHFNYCLALLNKIWTHPPFPALPDLVAFDCKYTSPGQVLVVVQQLEAVL